jgi:hypothetical protein
VIKLFWRACFGLFSSSLANNNDLTIINTGFATLHEDDLEGLGLMKHGVPSTYRNSFDRFRL